MSNLFRCQFFLRAFSRTIWCVTRSKLTLIWSPLGRVNCQNFNLRFWF
jgi:hypothetical protein